MFSGAVPFLSRFFLPAPIRLTAASDAVSTASPVVEDLTGFALILNSIEYFIMVPLVYIALLFCLAGIIWRIISIFRAPAPPFSLKIYPSAKKPALAALADTFLMPQIRKHKPLFWINLIVFHCGLVLLVLGHLDILPQISIMSEESRHMIGAGLDRKSVV